MSIKSLDHICIAVNNIEDTTAIFRDVLGLEMSAVQEIPEQGIRLAFFDLGNAKIELIEPLDESSHLRKYLNKKGPGLHHIALEVDNINKSLSGLKSNDVRLIDETPRTGAHGKKIAFIHPSNSTGTLIELCE